MTKKIKRILIIDDDKFLIQMMEVILTKAGYTVISASQGKMGVDILNRVNRNLLDLIIVDLMMPEMDGLAFLNWLRNEEKLSIPALVLTGMTTSMTTEKAMVAGAAAILHKPLRAAELIAKINEIESTL